MTRAFARGLVLLLSLAFASSISGAAHAERLDKHYEGVWLIEAFTFDDDSAFSHCTMSASYDDGVSLIFYLDNEFYWGIRLVGKSWRLKAGDTYDVQLTVDDAKPTRLVAEVSDTRWVHIAVKGNDRLFDQLRTGRMLYIDTSAELMSFNLQGTSRGLLALFDCVDRRVRTASRTNPFEGSSAGQNSLSENPDDADENPFVHDTGQDRAAKTGGQAEANDVTNRLLQRAGITGYQIKDGLPDPAGFSTIWRNGKGVIGALLVVTEGGREDAEESLGAMMNGTREDCAGKFVSNLDASVRMHGAYMPRAYGGCSDGGKSVMTYLSAFQRRQGGYYVFFTATVPGGPASMAAELDERIREAAYQLQSPAVSE
ncbi:MAG: hypothetical protein HYU58_00570 [Proteobacteria bacterium]|nr:hypothetical protein [Pseudomonadota bacterium]